MDTGSRIATTIPLGGPQPPRLLDRVRLAIRARHYSTRTEEAYIAWIMSSIEAPRPSGVPRTGSWLPRRPRRK